MIRRADGPPRNPRGRSVLGRWVAASVGLLAVLALGPALVAADRGLGLDRKWYEADRSPAGLAPTPSAHPQAVVQVYAARAFRWRGVFAVHTWVAAKAPGAEQYELYQVTRWNRSSVRSTTATPDRAWFGSTPHVLIDIRGERAEALVSAIRAAAEQYPYAGTYRAWPGPNSNTFTAWLARTVDELDVELPPTAIGKDYLAEGWIARTPSATGYQISAGGLFGIGLARAEGLELNILGLIFGVDPQELSLKLPGLGRVGAGRETGTGTGAG